MDGLISIIVIALVSYAISSGKNKKKKAEKRRGAQAPSVPPVPKMPKAETISYTKAEWEAFLKDAKAAKPTAEAPKKSPDPDGAPAREAAPVAEAPRPQKSAPQPEPASAEAESFGQGTVSTQGESDAEHERHCRRILEEEARREKRLEEMRDLERLNLQKLRAAVVMREILDKPVSLRPRGRR